MTSAGTASGARQVGQLSIRNIVSASLHSPQYSWPHSKHWPHLPWSSSLAKQIGHWCTGSSAWCSPLVVAAGDGARGDADAGGSPGVGGGLQWALWLPPREDQCCPWHLRLQYQTARHAAHIWLTLPLPVTSHLALAQRRVSPSAVFFPIFVVFKRGGAGEPENRRIKTTSWS